jgi:hypothetical protein
MSELLETYNEPWVIDSVNVKFPFCGRVRKITNKEAGPTYSFAQFSAMISLGSILKKNTHI